MSDQAIVHIVDDDEGMLHALQALLQSQYIPSVTYTSAEAFLEHAKWTVPGCLVLDLRMPGMGGVGLLHELSDRQGEPPPTIVLTAHGTIDDAIRAVRSGAVEFLEKPCPNDRLLNAISAAIDKDRRRLERLRAHAELDRRLDTLTPRERDILDDMMAAHSGPEIAEHLGLQSKSVQIYRSRVLHKLGYRTTLELVRHLLDAFPDRWSTKA